MSTPVMYRARAFRNGKWQNWHEISEVVYQNRLRCPREHYQVQALTALHEARGVIAKASGRAA